MHFIVAQARWIAHYINQTLLLSPLGKIKKGNTVTGLRLKRMSCIGKEDHKSQPTVPRTLIPVVTARTVFVTSPAWPLHRPCVGRNLCALAGWWQQGCSTLHTPCLFLLAQRESRVLMYFSSIFQSKMANGQHPGLWCMEAEKSKFSHPAEAISNS